MNYYLGKERFMVLALILIAGFGCRFAGFAERAEPAGTPQTATVITKEALKKRLGAKGVRTSLAIMRHMPNPLLLHLRFAGRNNEFFLNGERFDNFGALADTLREVFKDRENNGVIKEGTNEIEKTITLPAYQRYIDEYDSKNIHIEDFEKLVDDLQKEGFDQIELDLNEENSSIFETLDFPPDEKLPAKPMDDGKGVSSSEKGGETKTISGGVLNGKAISRPEPVYPAAAKAVRASGTVNVQVTVDENGNVASANAVSGHPLLRAAAVAAARGAKFNPTLLGGKAVKVNGILVYNFTP